MQEEHPTWKLPERRVTKFCKKQIKSKGKAADSVTHDDDSAASQASMAKRVARSTKKKFGSVLKPFKKKSKATTEIKTPPSHIQTDGMTAETSSLVSPISSVGEEETTNVVTPQKVEEKKEDAKPEQDAKDLSVVYEDDNDGSKEDQWCGDLCIIL